MRQIKFRAWDKRSHVVQPVPSLTWYSHSSPNGNPQNIHVGLDSIDHFELMQFTGLLDKNGKEIYEGDIVRIGEYTEPDPEGEIDGGWLNDSVHEVQWYGDYPAFDLYPYPEVESNALQFYADIRPDGEAIEVIGNIYENPSMIPNARRGDGSQLPRLQRMVPLSRGY